MDNIYKVRWSGLVKIITATVIVILLLVEVEIICSMISSNNRLLYGSLLLVVINLVIMIIILNVPLYLKITDDGIILKKIRGSIHIKYSEINFIQTYNSNSDMKLFGSGGFFGYIGIFSNAEYGWYASYVVDPKQSFLIGTKQSKKYVFSSDGRENIINTVKTYVNESVFFDKDIEN
jgi:hypothetical protein